MITIEARKVPHKYGACCGSGTVADLQLGLARAVLPCTLAACSCGSCMNGYPSLVPSVDCTACQTLACRAASSKAAAFGRTAAAVQSQRSSTCTHHYGRQPSIRWGKSCGCMVKTLPLRRMWCRFQQHDRACNYGWTLSCAIAVAGRSGRGRRECLQQYPRAALFCFESCGIIAPRHVRPDSARVQSYPCHDVFPCV